MQSAILDALKLRALGAWCLLERQSIHVADMDADQYLFYALLSALCANPLQDREKDRASLLSLADVAPRSACAIALSRSLFAFAQQQLLTDQRACAESTLRQALAFELNAVVATGMVLPSSFPDQLFSKAGYLTTAISCQLELALAGQRQQLPSHLILVLGMHRSGTSALAGLLVQSGLDGPLDIMPANSHNPLGFYESIGAMEINDQLLGKIGSSWSSSRTVSEEFWVRNLPAVSAWQAAILKLLHNSYPPNARAVLKDPRLCLLLRGLLPWLHSGLIASTVFLPIRHPAEVVESLWRAQAIPRSQGLLLWLRYVLESERYSRGLNRLIVRHSDLMADPESVLRSSHRALMRDPCMAPVQFPSDVSIVKFIDPRLYRCRSGSVKPEWVAEDRVSIFYDLAIDVYSVLMDLSIQEGERESALDKLWLVWASVSL